jgi:oligopeptide/dipeptide ABC transporter ATP-binding protein
MYAGQIVEKAPTMVLFDTHRNRYSAALLRSMPRLEHEPHQKLATIPGAPPRLSALPGGCRFAPRCGFAEPACSESALELIEETPGHQYRCIRPSPAAAPAGDSAYVSVSGRQQ